MNSASEGVPAVSQTQLLEDRSREGEAVTSPAGVKSVLVVEDDPAVARLVRLYLAQAGYEVLAAEDGAEGLRIALEKRPTLVVLDLNLPGMDGIDVCKNLRASSDVSIIMVTARVEEEDRLRGLNIGADDYVTKPFSPARTCSPCERSASPEQSGLAGDPGAPGSHRSRRHNDGPRYPHG